MDIQCKQHTCFTIITIISGTLLLFVIVVIVVIVSVYAFIFKIRNEYEQGNNYSGALYQYSKAMEIGNRKAALFWAEKLKQFCGGDKIFMAQAYELNGEYKKATELYSTPDILIRARIFYKINNRTIAFRNYCLYALTVLVKQQEKLKSNVWNTKNIALASIRDEIIMNNHIYTMRLTAFVDYDDFLNFMEEEYTKLGSPIEYEEAMQLFRAIKNEIIEEDIPRSKASDELDALRNRIREERR